MLLVLREMLDFQDQQETRVAVEIKAFLAIRDLRERRETKVKRVHQDQEEKEDIQVLISRVRKVPQDKRGLKEKKESQEV